MRSALDQCAVFRYFDMGIHIMSIAYESYLHDLCDMEDQQLSLKRGIDIIFAFYRSRANHSPAHPSGMCVVFKIFMYGLIASIVGYSAVSIINQ
jgi:hypothetical protein